MIDDRSPRALLLLLLLLMMMVLGCGCGCGGMQTLGELLLDCGPVVDAAGASTPMADVISGAEYLGLYFSAHWCPPCRMFTPELSTWYTKQTAAGGPLAGKLEIIFMTADRTAAAHAEYLAEMPWKAVPYAQKGTVEPIGTRLRVRGYPTLVFVNTKDVSGMIIVAVVPPAG